MNWLTAGNSHGNCLIGIIDGLCYGINITKQYIANELKRRRESLGRSKRQKQEKDEFEVISGVKNNITTGLPVGIIVYNSKPKEIKPYSYFTPTHSELMGTIKYSHFDGSIIKERASARETVIRVALFSFTKRFLELLGIKIKSKVIQCYNEKNEKKFKEVIENFREEGDSFGGIFEIEVENFPIGIGGFSQGLDRLQSKLSQMIFSIGSIKAVEFGIGKDIIKYKASNVIKKPELLGGICAGITDGNSIIIRVSTRPLAGIKKQMQSYDLKTAKKINVSINTSDTTSVFAASIISEHLVSYVLADEIFKKFGNENFEKIKKEFNLWREKTKKILKIIKE